MYGVGCDACVGRMECASGLKNFLCLCSKYSISYVVSLSTGKTIIRTKKETKDFRTLYMRFHHLSWISDGTQFFHS